MFKDLRIKNIVKVLNKLIKEDKSDIRVYWEKIEKQYNIYFVHNKVIIIRTIYPMMLSLLDNKMIEKIYINSKKELDYEK